LESIRLSKGRGGGSGTWRGTVSPMSGNRDGSTTSVQLGKKGSTKHSRERNRERSEVLHRMQRPKEIGTIPDMRDGRNPRGIGKEGKSG